MRLIAFCALFGTSFLSAQTFSVGVKGGGFFTEPAERSDNSKRYVVGPSLEIAFPFRVAVEVDALYSRFGAGSLRGHSVEFPVLGKYYFSGQDAAIRPYASGGVSFRNIWLDENRRGSGLRGTDPAIGAVAAGGVAFRLGPLKIAPEIRYTRWGGYNYPATNPNELQGLLGIRF